MTTCKLISKKGAYYIRYTFSCENSTVQGPIQVILCTGDDDEKAKRRAEELVEDNPNGNHNYCQEADVQN